MPVSICPICTRQRVSRSFLNHVLHVPRSLLNDGTLVHSVGKEGGGGGRRNRGGGGRVERKRGGYRGGGVVSLPHLHTSLGRSLITKHALYLPRSLLNDGTEWDRRGKKQRRGRKS